MARRVFGTCLSSSTGVRGVCPGAHVGAHPVHCRPPVLIQSPASQPLLSSYLPGTTWPNFSLTHEHPTRVWPARPPLSSQCKPTAEPEPIPFTLHSPVFPATRPSPMLAGGNLRENKAQLEPGQTTLSSSQGPSGPQAMPPLAAQPYHPHWVCHQRGAAGAKGGGHQEVGVGVGDKEAQPPRC